MRWTPGKRSVNLEDRRASGGMMRGGLRLGLGGTAILLVLSLLFGRNFLADFGADPAGGTVTAPVGGEVAPASSPAEEELVQFVSFVLDDAQETWVKLLPTVGAQYQDAKLVLFRDATQSACGIGESATGPFYCPADQRVYIDLGFYNELRSRFGAPGDFAQAYVIAHEIGHHVQHLLGTDARVRQLQRGQPRTANQLSVRLELQADCYAGVWGNSTAQRRLLEQGDVEEGLNAAAAIGDDRLQRSQTGRVAPDAFTHGSSEQRVAWFKRGLETGRPDACDTFSGRGP